MPSFLPWRHVVLSFACSILVVPASAQPVKSPLYVGTWNVVIREGFRPERTARLVLRESTGTWQDGDRSSMPCTGKTFPVTVQRSDRLQLEFTVRRQDVVPSCPKLSFKVAPVDAKTLVGGTGAGKDDGHGHDHEHERAQEGSPAVTAVLEILMTKADGAVKKR